MKRYITVLAALFLLIAPVASAHTTLVSSNPAHDTTIQQWPDHFTLTFAEPLQVLKGADINKVSVTNASALSLEGATTVHGAVLDVAVAPNAAEGPVKVSIPLPIRMVRLLRHLHRNNRTNLTTENQRTLPLLLPRQSLSSLDCSLGYLPTVANNREG